MLTEVIREKLERGMRGYAPVSPAVVDIIAMVNDAYYLGRKYSFRRQRDGSVTMTDRKNGMALSLSGEGMVLSDSAGNVVLWRDGCPGWDGVMGALKCMHDGCVPMDLIW